MRPCSARTLASLILAFPLALPLPAGAQQSPLPSPGEPLPSPGEEVEAVLDWERRYRHMRFHTALHLLCAVVPAPVTGGQVAEDKARLDFDIEMERLAKEAIEEGLNRLVAGGHAVRPRSADGWRRLRDEWAAFVSAHPETPLTDEARVRAIEAAYEAWTTAGDPDDEAAFRRDARAYLERPDARQAERVRRLLRPGR